jgi:hypothetical protein
MHALPGGQDYRTARRDYYEMSVLRPGMAHHLGDAGCSKNQGQDYREQGKQWKNWQ